jgi:hypothetical protein
VYFVQNRLKPTVPTEVANYYISFGQHRGSSVRILAVFASSCSAPATGNVVIKDGVNAMADPYDLESYMPCFLSTCAAELTGAYLAS